MPLRPLFTCAALLVLAACARPLTQNETYFAQQLFGDTLDTEEIEVLAGVGILPLPRSYPALADPFEEVAAPPPPRKPPEDLCVRRPSPRRGWRWPAAFVLEDHIYFSFDYYAEDAFEGLPDTVPFPASILMAHELVHIWQWQHRATTQYTSLAAANESLESRDPYFWVPEAGREFLSYGYEQQAAMVQDFVCYALFDPEDPVMDELAGVLRPVLPVDGFLAAFGR